MPVWRMGQCHISIDYHYDKGRCLVSNRRGMMAYGPTWQGIAQSRLVPRLSHSLASQHLTEDQQTRLFQLLYQILLALSPCIQLDSWRHTRTTVTTTNSFPAGRLHVHEYWYCAASSVPSEKSSSKVEVERSKNSNQYQEPNESMLRR